MFRTVILGLGATALLATAAWAQPKPAETSMKNPLLAPWGGPYGGVPAFDQVKVVHF
jgi:peptidyl-dipeptidase Dcp